MRVLSLNDMELVAGGSAQGQTSPFWINFDGTNNSSGTCTTNEWSLVDTNGDGRTDYVRLSGCGLSIDLAYQQERTPTDQFEDAIYGIGVGFVGGAFVGGLTGGVAASITGPGVLAGVGVGALAGAIGGMVTGGIAGFAGGITAPGNPTSSGGNPTPF